MPWGGITLRDAVQFLIVLFSSVTVYGLLFPFLKNLGFPDPARMENLDSFIKMEADATNTTFLYCSGWVVFMAVFLFYRMLVFRRRENNTAGLLGKAVFSIPFLAIGAGIILWFLFGHVLGNISSLTPVFLNPGAIAAMVLLLALAVFENKIPPLAGKFLDASFVLGIMILTFRNDVNYFDFSNFLGAVNDIMLGKDVLQNVVCQYGFFNLYFLAALFKVFSVHDLYAGLSIINSVFYILGYGFIYLFFRHYTRHRIFSILAVFSIFIISFYALNNVPQHWAPSVGFLRFGTIFPVFCLLYSRRLRQNKYWEWLLAFFTVLSVFWVIETGIYIFTAIAGMTLLKYLLLQDSQERKSLLKIFPKMAVIFIVIVLILTLRIVIKYGTWPAWGDLIYFQKYYLVSGLGVQPLTNFYMWPVAAFIYWAAAYVCLTYYDRIRYADAWLFLGFFGMPCLLYYISIGIIDHLARAALPATILFFVFLGFIVKCDFVSPFGRWKVRWKYPVYFLCVCFSVWLAPVVSRYGEEKTLWALLTGNGGELLKYSHSDSLERFFPKPRVQEFRYDVASIVKLVPPGAPLAIISKHDTLYHIYSRRKSLFKVAFYPTLSYTKEQIPETVENILKSNQKYLFIDNSSYHCYNNTINPNNAKLKVLLSRHFTGVASLGLLDLYVRE